MPVDDAIRVLLREELRTVVREEVGPVLESIRRTVEGLRGERGPDQNPVAEPLLTVQECARYCGVADETVRSWIGRKFDPLLAYRPGGGREYRIRRADLEAFLSRNAPSTAQTAAETGSEVTLDSQVAQIIDRVRSRSSKTR